MAKEILFIGDAWDTLDHPRDSSLYLSRIAESHFGLKCFWATPESIFLDQGKLKVSLLGELKQGELAELSSNQSVVTLDRYHSVHWRADPPVDIRTMRLWSLLSATLPNGGPKFLNPPAALLTWNEKFSTQHFPNLSVPMLVSNQEKSWHEFFERPRTTPLVLKPCADAASRGVQILPTKWEDALKIIRFVQADSGPWIILQEFDPSLDKVGETRVFVVDGKIAGAIRKRPHPKRPIMSLDVPEAERPKLEVVKPTGEQIERAHLVIEQMSAAGIYIATIDFIGPRILEINITSPGLIAWLDSHLSDSEKLAMKYWKGLL